MYGLDQHNITVKYDYDYDYYYVFLCKIFSFMNV